MPAKDAKEEVEEVVSVRIPKKSKGKGDKGSGNVHANEKGVAVGEKLRGDGGVNDACPEVETFESVTPQMPSRGRNGGTHKVEDEVSREDRKGNLVEESVSQITNESRVENSSNKEDEERIATTSDIENLLSGDIEEEAEGSSAVKKVVLVVLILAVLTGIVAGGVYFYKNSQKPSQPSSQAAKPIVRPTNTPKPSPTSKPVDFGKLTVSILNGSGKPGEAGKVEKMLSEIGFKETDTGNADSYDYTETKVQAKSEISDEVFAKLSEVLGNDYVLERSKSPLSEKSEYDVVITVGSKKPADTPTPTEEKEPEVSI